MKLGNRIAKFIFCNLWGWTIKGEVKVPKFVIIAMPHTSNWDFPVGLFLRPATNINYCYYIGKDSLFKFPYGFIFRFLGGMPVDRSKSNNFVENVAAMYDKHEKFGICIAPEGTRKHVDKLKTGFYYIAMAAKVPIIMLKFDWSTKTAEYAEPFMPTGDYEKDLAHLRAFYDGTQGKNYVFNVP